MTPYGALTYVPLLAMLACAAAEDLRSRQIRNWLTLSLAATGLAQSFFYGGPTPLQSVGGLLAGFGLTVLLFAMGALGAGDVKLLAGVGAWLGAWPVLVVFVGAAIIGMCIVIAQALMQGRTRILLRNSAVVAINLVHISDVGVAHASETGRSCRSVERPLPYAVPVLLAVLVLLGSAWAGGS